MSFKPILFVTLGVLIILNAMALLTGQVLALVPLVSQIVIISLVYFRVSWAHVAVIVWALFLVVSGTAMWLAVLLDGTSWVPWRISCNS